MKSMQPSTGQSPEPGERRRLDRPPSDRYQQDAAAGARGPSAEADSDADSDAPLPARELILRGIGVGIVGAIAMTILGGPLSVTVGLVAAAGAIGWVIGMVSRPLRLAAIVIALVSVVLGLAGIWLYAGVEGGVLGPIEYLAEVQGILVPIELAAAGVLAAAAS